MAGEKVVLNFEARKTRRWCGAAVELPRWMKEEMKGTELKKDDFRVK
jgi:DNA-binding protein H-NS